MSTPTTKQQLPQQATYERVNFLYQAAHAVMEGTADKAQVAQFYSKTMHSISRRAVLKLDPSLKRSLCKKCRTLLIPGVTATLRLRAKKETHFAMTCLNCKTKRQLLCRPGHNLWCNKPEALVPAVAAKKAKPPAKVLPNQISVNPNSQSSLKIATDAVKSEVKITMKPEITD